MTDLLSEPGNGILAAPIGKGAAGMRATPAEAIAVLRKQHGSLSEVARQLEMDRSMLWQITQGDAEPSWERGEQLRAAAGFAAPPMTPAEAVGRIVDHMTWRAAAAFVAAHVEGYIDTSYLQKIKKETVVPRWSLGNVLVELGERMKTP
ncbi:MAG: hypothetical protein GF320_14205 [Armatimonadia bacterium]|nr:hypothetical protein [Armatimonadia bacterium]